MLSDVGFLGLARVVIGPSSASQRTSLADCRNQSLALSALVMVSWVVKVLEAMMKMVVSGLQSFKTSARSVPSMLETKCVLRSRFE